MNKAIVKDENYYCILGWMVTKLKLSGLPLQLYAIIYGFSQTNAQECSASREYLAEFTGSSVRGVSKALAKLVEQGLIAKSKSGVKNTYYALSLQEQSSCKQENENRNKVPDSPDNIGTEFPKNRNKVPTKQEQSAHNNIDYNINTTASDSKTDATRDDGFAQIRDTYERVTGSLMNSKAFEDINELVKKGVKPNLICRVLNDMAAKPNIRYRRAAALSELRQLCARGITTLELYVKDKAEYERGRNSAEPPSYRSAADTKQMFEQEDNEPIYYGT